MPPSSLTRPHVTVALVLLGLALTSKAEEAPGILAPQPDRTVLAPATSGRAAYVLANPGVTGLPPGAPSQAGLRPGAPPFGPNMPSRPVLPKPTPEDAKKLLAALRNQKMCKLPLELTVKDATLEEVVAQVQAKLPQDAPQIEIRGVRPIRLSFALKGSTVGEALGAVGGLAGAILWVTGERLLLAPQSALTTEEGGSQASSGSAWNASRPAGGNEFQRVFSSLIADDLSTKVAANTDGQGLLPPAKTTFNMLSPQSQEMLQELVRQTNEMTIAQNFGNSGNAATRMLFTLSADTVVEVNSGGSRMVSNGQQADVLGVSQGGSKMSWSTNGSGSSRSLSIPFSNPQGSAPPSPFIDPSANKS